MHISVFFLTVKHNHHPYKDYPQPYHQFPLYDVLYSPSALLVHIMVLAPVVHLLVLWVRKQQVQAHPHLSLTHYNSHQINFLIQP